MAPFEAEKLPIKSITWEGHVSALGRANRALAKYDGVLYGVPNPNVFLSPLMTKEAVLSSKIEGTQASFGEVLQFEAGEEITDAEKRTDIKEIQNYRKSLALAEQALQTMPFNLNLMLRMHEQLLDSVRGRDKGRGRFRTFQNWIGPEGCAIEQATFVPPSPLELEGLLTNWENFYHSDQPDPLVQLAILHAQFEVIHPFLDGNGRIGRILIPLFLHEKKVLSRPVFYLSSFLEANRDEYIGKLRELGSEGSWDRWIDFFLRAVETQADLNTVTARAILDLYESLKSKVLSLTNSAYAVPLLDFLFERPIFSSSFLIADARMPSAPMVQTLLRQLRDGGIIRVLREGAGRRPGVYGFPKLLNLCEGAEIF